MTSQQELLDKLSELFEVRMSRNGQRKMFFHDYEICVHLPGFLIVYNLKSKNLTFVTNSYFRIDSEYLNTENIQKTFLDWFSSKVQESLSDFDYEKEKFEKRKARFESLEKRANKTKEILKKIKP